MAREHPGHLLRTGLETMARHVDPFHLSGGSGEAQQMPPTAPLESARIEQIRAWIEAGAQDN